MLCEEGWDKTLWKMFLAWDVDLLGAEEKSDKSFSFAVLAVQKFEAYAKAILKDWKVAEFDGKPATELSYKIDLQNGFHYRAFIDVVLQNRETGQLLVLEVKTTGAKVVREETYKNSAQGLCYSIALDKISSGHSSFHVWYLVYQTGSKEWENFPFSKSRLDKAKWIKMVLHDCKRIQGYIDDNFFPMHGESCLDYFRPCKYYGMCEMSDRALLAPKEELDKRVQRELEQKFSFEFTLEEIVNQQLAS